jgi:hypothetical protein
MLPNYVGCQHDKMAKKYFNILINQKETNPSPDSKQGFPVVLMTFL